MNIKTLIVAAALAFAGASAASAADAIQPGFVIVEEANATLPGVTNSYVGVTGGVSNRQVDRGTVGVVLGHNLNDNVAVEGQYEYRADKDHLLTGNVLLGQKIGPVKPYVLGGVGYRWSDDRGDSTVYAVGGGLKADVTDTIEADARYRYVNSFDGEKRDNRFTVGLNYKF